MAAVMLLTVFMTAFAYSPAAEKYSASSEPLYAERVFGADIITVDIAADEDEWQNMLDNAMDEQYISAEVAVNGKKFSNVGIRPKGNNSLQQVASSDSDRYSFKIKFDEFIDGQTCYGLDMLVLNDMLGDATYMKEYTAFDMMRYMGIETPYYGYAMITLNGEDWGLYFALEAYNDSYKQRVSGDESGELYNVKASMSRDGFEENGGSPAGENAESFPEPKVGSESGDKPNMDTEQETGTETFTKDKGFGRNGMGEDGFGRNGGGGMGAASSGGSLLYTDDDSGSYSAIFGNAVGSGSDEKDYQKVITALKALNEGKDIEKYFDVDEILRYLAVHTAVVNLDSYSSNMAQNYYIYEYDGVLQILPWDYNYAWGAFQSHSASDVVNFPADTPVSGVEMSERPLIAKLFENEEYFERYHQYLRELLDGYLANERFAEKIDGINELIGKYVETDPTAFYSYDEYLTALEAFKNLASLRAESLYGQLDGTVPSTTEGQLEEPDKLIDASSVQLSELGGGMMGEGFESFDRSDSKPSDFGGESFPFDGGNGGIPALNQNGGEVVQPPDIPEENIPQRKTDSFNVGKDDESSRLPQDGEDDQAASRSGAAVTALYLAILICAAAGISLVKRNF